MNQEVTNWINNRNNSTQLLELSIIIPAYNEERRLPKYLIDVLDYCDKKNFTYEVIIVDDGSKDATSTFVKKISKICPQVKLIRLPKNYGKGHAVKTGVLSAIGKKILFTDADGATPIEEYEKLLTVLVNNEGDLAIASRALKDDNTTVKTNLFRKYIGRTFNFFVKTLLFRGFSDTQCGFKLFNADIAKYLFEHQKANQFSFDIEILYIAKKSNFKIAEVPVNWTNISGSKVNVAIDSIKMFLEIFRIRFSHNKITVNNYNNFLLNKEKEESFDSENFEVDNQKN